MGKTSNMVLNKRSYIDNAWIQKQIDNGRGKGEGTDYHPWIIVRDFSSKGNSWRLQLWLNGRTCHFLSDGERDYAYCLSWGWPHRVVEIYEQWPLLPIEECIDIADELGIKYPKVRHPDTPGKQMFPVLTSDFYLLVKGSESILPVARTYKKAIDLNSEGTLELLAIEYEYWRRRQVQWGIVTDRTMPKYLAKNMHYFYKHYFREQFVSDFNVPEEFIDPIGEVMTSHVLRGDVFNQSALKCDRQFGLHPGTTLAISWHFIANRRWPVDMLAPLDPAQPLKLNIQSESNDE